MSTRSSRKKTSPKFTRAYDRAILRSAFVSLFWAVIMERKKRAGFTLQALAKKMGTNKGEVSRWFSGDPNWTVNTIANLANALELEMKIEARDRSTGFIFTPAGLHNAQICQLQPITRSSRVEGAPEQMPAASTNAEGNRPLLLVS
jgi:transcriptional regulator with XRE-family HTH domain